MMNWKIQLTKKKNWKEENNLFLSSSYFSYFIWNENKIRHMCACSVYAAIYCHSKQTEKNTPFCCCCSLLLYLISFISLPTFHSFTITLHLRINEGIIMFVRRDTSSCQFYDFNWLNIIIDVFKINSFISSFLLLLFLFPDNKIKLTKISIIISFSKLTIS